MEDICGVKLREFPLGDLKKVSDLIYFEGPLLSLFKDRFGNSYFYYWVDNDEATNRWLVLQVSNEQFKGYIDKKISLKEIVSNPVGGIIYSVDILPIRKKLSYRNVQVTSPNEIPDSYIPEDNSYYEFEPIEYKRYKDVYQLLLDGTWTLSDLSIFPEVYSKVYAFMLSILSSTGALVNVIPQTIIPRSYRSYPWRGGFSAVYFFNDLIKTLPKSYRPKVIFIQYASPGAMGLELIEPVAAKIRDTITAFVDNNVELKRLYKDVYKFLSESELLTETRAQDLPGDENLRKKLLDYALNLANLLSISSDGFYAIYDNAGKNELMTLKIILSYYRRVLKLARYQTEGKIVY